MIPNDHLRDLMTAADENGWYIVEVDNDLTNRRYSHLVLMDGRGGRITIATEYGLDTLAYVREIKAHQRTPIKVAVEP